MLFERPGSRQPFAPSSARVTPSGHELACDEIDNVLREIGSLRGPLSAAPAAAAVSEEELQWFDPFREPAPPQAKRAVAPKPPRHKPAPQAPQAPQAPVAVPPQTPKATATLGAITTRTRRSVLVENGSARRLGPLDRAKVASGAEEAAERRRRGEQARAREIKLKQERDVTPRRRPYGRRRLNSTSKPLSSVFAVGDTIWYADPEQQRANGY
eukprot:COSAG02_NODE_758_length_17516_cov_53.301085_8_plen_213_part_00